MMKCDDHDHKLLIQYSSPFQIATQNNFTNSDS